jgi:hypothetical protein
LSSNLGLPASQANILQLNLSYDLNVLDRLQRGTFLENDQSRRRTTHSILLEAGYSFTNRLSADVFLSYVRQERNIQRAISDDFDYTQGLGDAVLLLKYKALSIDQDNTTLTIAAGVKFPLGASDLKDQSGITLNADLQPGSGAWDGILWSQFTHNLTFRPSMSFAATATYSRKGVNDNYLAVFNPTSNQTNAQAYKFGDEYQVMLSLSDRLLLGNALIDPSITFRYRKAFTDQQNDIDLPNTGGEWIFFTPGISYWLLDKLSLNANIDLPVYSFIEGLQVTPTYRLNVGIYYQINFNPKDPHFPF